MSTRKPSLSRLKNARIKGKDEAAGAADASRVAGSKLVLE